MTLGVAGQASRQSLTLFGPTLVARSRRPVWAKAAHLPPGGIVKDQNYRNAFMAIAEDSGAMTGLIPAAKAQTLASLQYGLMTSLPYGYTQEDIFFEIPAIHQGILDAEKAQARTMFFLKVQPCLRTSPLGKRYGWGIHFRADGRMALYAVDSSEYAAYSNDPSLRQMRALRSSRSR